jgi:D-threo-aldose 1-dehydrogenase
VSDTGGSSDLGNGDDPGDPRGPGDWTRPRRLGRRGPEVTGLGFGGAAIGNLFAGVTDDDAEAAVDAAWEAGIRSFDTAPLYGHGRSERRLGRALRRHPRDGFVLSSKVGRLLDPPVGTREPTIFTDVGDVEPHFDFSRDGVLRSIDESLERLGTDRLDIALVHDPDDHEHDAMQGAFPALVALREQGVISAVGCGMNQTAMLERFVDRVDLDCVLLAGRHTLLEPRGAEGLLAGCLERQVGVVLGGVFNSGVLVDPDRSPTFDYAPAPAAVVERARALRDRCEARGVALPAAALQFARRHPAVTTVLIGARSAAEVALDVGYASVRVPDELWAELTGPAGDA